MPEERKYCKGNCGTILWSEQFRPNRKYCDNCNDILAYKRSKTSQVKNYEEYRKRDNEAHRLKVEAN